MATKQEIRERERRARELRLERQRQSGTGAGAPAGAIQPSIGIDQPKSKPVKLEKGVVRRNGKLFKSVKAEAQPSDFGLAGVAGAIAELKGGTLGRRFAETQVGKLDKASAAVNKAVLARRAEDTRKILTGLFGKGKAPATPEAEAEVAVGGEGGGVVSFESGKDIGAGNVKAIFADGTSKILTSREFQALQEAITTRAATGGGGGAVAAGAPVGEGGLGALDISPTGQTIGAETAGRGFDLPAERAEAQRLLGQAPTPEVVAPPAPDIEQRNIWASTFRESAIPAAIEGGIAAATIGGGALLAGGATAPFAPIGAVIGFIGGFARKIYSSFKSNQQEEVKNVWNNFRGLKSGATLLPQLVRMGATSPEQAMVDLQYIEQQVDYFEATLRQKEKDGDFIADISDYDGRMAHLIQWKNIYLVGIRRQIETAIRVPAYNPRDIYIPEYEGDEPIEI